MTNEVENGGKTSTCTLPYPDRFRAALQFMTKPPAGTKPISDDTRLLLYALSQQATIGPCKETKPWGWNVVETAKWQTWSQLGEMSSVEAMRLYVRELEEEQPDWWARMGAYTPAPADPEKNVPTVDTSVGLGAVQAPDEWFPPTITGAKRPPPRYEHATTIVEGKMFVVGGNCGGRFLSDVWTLSLEKLEWMPTVFSGGKQAPVPPPSSGPDKPIPPQATMPPCAGHALVPWGSSILCIGGHTKAKDQVESMPVRVLETHAMAWSVMQPTGPCPANKGGHTATLIGNRVYVFGGDDNSRRATNDLHILDLEGMVWSKPEIQGTAPLPRSAHVATSYAGRYLLIFGGGSVAHCFQDLWVLDTETMEWFQPPTEGDAPSERAGHAAAALGDMWYIVGGGNNTTGCLDMLSLDMSELGTGSLKWSEVARATDRRSSIASEGLTLQAAPQYGALIALGGYNGKYHNGLFVYKPTDFNFAASSAPTPRQVKTPSKSPKPTKTSDIGSSEPADSETAPLIQNDGAPRLANGANDTEDKIAKLESARKEAEESAVRARESAAHELALMRRQLVSAQNALADAEQSLDATRIKLTAEQSKNFKLEVEVAELRQQLGQMDEMEKELEQLRRQAEEAQSKKGYFW